MYNGSGDVGRKKGISRGGYGLGRMTVRAGIDRLETGKTSSRGWLSGVAAVHGSKGEGRWEISNSLSAQRENMSRGVRFSAEGQHAKGNNVGE